MILLKIIAARGINLFWKWIPTSLLNWYEKNGYFKYKKGKTIYPQKAMGYGINTSIVILGTTTKLNTNDSYIVKKRSLKYKDSGYSIQDFLNSKPIPENVEYEEKEATYSKSNLELMC